jgi:hypothetical protein
MWTGDQMTCPGDYIYLPANLLYVGVFAVASPPFASAHATTNRAGEPSAVSKHDARLP